MNDVVREKPIKFDIPRRIKRLGELAFNLWWVWNPEAQQLFKYIDDLLWEESYHNPIVFLRDVDRARLNAAVDDRYFLDKYDRVLREFDRYMKEKDTWFSKTYPNLTDEWRRLVVMVNLELLRTHLEDERERLTQEVEQLAANTCYAGERREGSPFGKR